MSAYARAVVADAKARWHPIKSVPKGIPLLLFDEEWEATLGSIQIGYKSDDGSFVVPETDEFHPTHWMGLPDPPAER